MKLLPTKIIDVEMSPFLIASTLQFEKFLFSYQEGDDCNGKLIMLFYGGTHRNESGMHGISQKRAVTNLFLFRFCAPFLRLIKKENTIYMKYQDIHLNVKQLV